MEKCDVQSGDGVKWLYTEKVKDHFLNPRNFVADGEPTDEVNGFAEVGNQACGDMMRVWIYVNPKTEKVEKFLWQTYGCASAIATTSVVSEMVTRNGGMSLEAAEKLSVQEILDELGGLPPKKIHCSVLGDKALREAIADYKAKK